MRFQFAIALCVSTTFFIFADAHFFRENKGRELSACSNDFSCAGDLVCSPSQLDKSVGSTCKARSKDGFCTSYKHCGAGTGKGFACIVNIDNTKAGKCGPKIALGQKCSYSLSTLLTHEIATQGGNVYSGQCEEKSAYCKLVDITDSRGKEGRCTALRAPGLNCTSDLECKGYCNEKICKKFKANEEKCTTAEECGGSDPPFSIGMCAVSDGASEGVCKDFGEEVAGFFAKLGGILIGIIVAVVLSIILCIYCCCCRKSKTVVVVQAAPAPIAPK